MALLKCARAAALLQEGMARPAPPGAAASPVTLALVSQGFVRMKMIRPLDERIAMLHRKSDSRTISGVAA